MRERLKSLSRFSDDRSNVTMVLMRTGRHRRFSRIALALGAQRRRCRKGIHVVGETHEIGAGISRTLCSVCGAVATIDLRDAEAAAAEPMGIPARKSLWE